MNPMGAETLRHSDALLVAWRLAELESSHLGCSELEPVHFLLGLLKIVDVELDSILDDILMLPDDRILQAKAHVHTLSACFSHAAIDTTRTRRRLRRALRSDSQPQPGNRLPRNPGARRAFEWAETEALRRHHNPVQPLHLLGGLLTLDDAPVTLALESAGSSPGKLHEAMRLALEMPLPQTHGTPIRSPDRQIPGEPGRRIGDLLGRDLTALAKEGKLLPVIGRRDEMRSLAQIMLRSRKNNAVLVGDAGVGKTAIVEGLAHRIAEGALASEFAGNRIIEISMSALVAGTNLRGDLEARLETLVKEASQNPDIILFIDEIHMLVGAGHASGGCMDAANILKPALGRGEIRMIGATTLAEYRRFIEPDAALARRFELIEVGEPTRSEAMEMVRGLRPSLQEHHRVVISDDALGAAVDYSIRYLPERRLPDKALDLLDQACSECRLQSLSGDLHARFRDGLVVGLTEVVSAVAHRCRIPVGELAEGESTRLLRMEAALNQRIKGQDPALAAVSEAIRMSRAGLRNQNRPVGVFLFTGPSGTGKTELARALAEFLFGDERGLIRFDMSECMDEHSVSKLIGSPPGFVGYEQGGQLAEKIRARPFSVLLLDEIEKAHPKIIDIFLQVFDTGFFTDSHGRKCDFRECVIVMTSNAGAESMRPGIGFHSGSRSAESNGALEDRFRRSLNAHFRPEFLNRITEIVVFHPLDLPAINQIIDLLLERLAASLKERNISLELDDSAKELLVREGFSPEKGAREMERAIDRLVGKPLAGLLLSGKANPGSRVGVGAEGGKMAFEVTGLSQQ